MVQIINTADLRLVQKLDGTSRLFLGSEEVPQREQRDIYCGLDSCLTREIKDRTKPLLDPETKLIYSFARALQAPVLEMNLHGILTDPFAISELLHHYGTQQEKLYKIVQLYAMVIWGESLNPKSYPQVKDILYTTLELPKQYKFEKGEQKLSVNRESLEALLSYRYSRPLILTILKHRDVSKKIGVLKTGVDSDKRMRFSYNVGGTNTGRFSCNKNVFGGGTNSQNITDELRKIFIATEGRKLAYLDLEQAESRTVAYYSGDEGYIAACEGSDLHTAVAQDVWPDLDWAVYPDPTWANPESGMSQEEVNSFNKALAEHAAVQKHLPH